MYSLAASVPVIGWHRRPAFRIDEERVMFTKNLIEAAQARVKTGADYPRLVQELKHMGVHSYDHVVADGSNVYHGADGHTVTISHSQEQIPVATGSSAEALRQTIAIHQQGKTDYPTFCRQAGEAGVAKWTSDLRAMTVTYSDRSGRAIVVEAIPQ
jgi:uncharacterized protein YbcV (DUF1398 family)